MTCLRLTFFTFTWSCVLFKCLTWPGVRNMPVKKICINIFSLRSRAKLKGLLSCAQWGNSFPCTMKFLLCCSLLLPWNTRGRIKEIYINNKNLSYNSCTILKSTIVYNPKILCGSPVWPVKACPFFFTCRHPLSTHVRAVVTKAHSIRLKLNIRIIFLKHTKTNTFLVWFFFFIAKKYGFSIIDLGIV